MEKVCGPDSCTGYNMLQEPHAAAFAALFRNVDIDLDGHEPDCQTESNPAANTRGALTKRRGFHPSLP